MSKARELAELGAVYDSGALSNRNVLINGSMQISQRATSVTGITGSGYNTVDRWRVGNSSAGTWTMAKTAVTDLPSFRNSLKMDCTTADGSLGVNDNLVIEQRFEGQNVQQFQKGTSSAKSWTLSFYVKGTTTGTYICQLFDNDNNRFVSKSYTISSANTWEYKTITFPPDTTGAINDSNGNNFIVSWYLAAGSNFTSGSLQTAWAGNTAANKAVGQVNLAASTSNDWQITGVQLEVGDTATPFEHRSFGDELLRCKRYFEVYAPVTNDDGSLLVVRTRTNVNNYNGIVYFLEKRAQPTCTLDYDRLHKPGVAKDTLSDISVTIGSGQTQSCTVNCTAANDSTISTTGFLGKSSGTAKLSLDAEL